MWSGKRRQENEARLITICLGRDWLDTGILRSAKRWSDEALIECRVSLSPLRDRHVVTGRDLSDHSSSTVCLHLQLCDISGTANVQLSRLAPEMFSADTTCIVSKRQ